MKNILLTVVMSICSLQLAHAQGYSHTYGPTNLIKSNLEHTTIYGPAELEQVKADSLTIIGSLQFKNLEVLYDTDITGPVQNSENGKFAQLKITGPFQAKQIACDTLSVIGPVNVKRLSVQNSAEIIGPLQAEDSHIHQLTITADEVTLEDVDVGDIVIKNDHNPKQTLRLKGKTLVTGNITFESGKGLLIKEKTVAIKGEVKGVAEQED